VRVLLVAVVAAIAATGAAHAAKPKPKPKLDVKNSARIWATVNVCDTKRHKNRVGVRVSMPGRGKKRELMYVRIKLEYKDQATGKWIAIGKGADSGWLKLGSSKYVRRETGRLFQLKPPPAGEMFFIRGKVSYQWRLGKTTIKRATRTTSGRISDVKEADPADYSAGICFLT
jgi:hypothetical protein